MHTKKKKKPRIFGSVRMWPGIKRAQCPVGSRVDVYYHPEKPETACLEPGHASIFFIVMIGGVSLLLILEGIGLGVFIFHRRPKRA